MKNSGLNETMAERFDRRVKTYGYIQASGMNFPGEVIHAFNSHTMKITFFDGTIWEGVING